MTRIKVGGLIEENAINKEVEWSPGSASSLKKKNTQHEPSINK